MSDLESHELIVISGWAADCGMWDSLLSALGVSQKATKVEWRHCLESGGSSRHGEALGNTNEKVVCIGWSIGALLALEAAARNPERFCALVLISGTARMTADRGYPGVSPRLLQAMRRKLAVSREEVVRDFFTTCFAPGKDERSIREACERAAAIPANGLMNGLDYLAKTDARALLPNIRTPTLVVHGDRDGIVPFECGEYLGLHLPAARFTPLTGFGHALPQTAAGVIAREIREFLNDACH